MPKIKSLPLEYPKRMSKLPVLPTLPTFLRNTSATSAKLSETVDSSINLIIRQG